MITNALIRIENVAGQLPAPFEKPTKHFPFWVLEIAVSTSSLPGQMSAILAELGRYKGLLAECAAQSPVLYLSISEEVRGPLLLPRDLVQAVAAFSGSIEVFKECE